MKIADIIIKNFKQVTRDRKNLFFLLLFPAIFMLVFGLAFGSESIDNSSINVAVVNLDNNDNTSFSTGLLDAVADVETNSSKKMFDLIDCSSESEALDELQKGNVNLIMVIDKDFSRDIFESITDTERNDAPKIIFKGDPTSTKYAIGMNIINSVSSEYISSIEKEVTGSSPLEIDVKEEGLSGTTLFTDFDYIAPGLIIFAILMTVTTVATNISSETENGMLNRLKLSYMNSYDYILGNLFSWCVIGIVQVIIMLIVALMLNFHWVGGLNSILLACLIGFIATIPSVALALIIVSLCNSSDQASSLSAIIAVPLSFLSGSFFPLPEAYVGDILGHPTQIYELLPWNQALTALKQVLIYGNGLESIVTNIILILISGLVLLLISIILFNRKNSSES